MRIACCTLLLPEEKHLAERIVKGKLSGISGHKLTEAMIQGIDSNLAFPVTVFNVINTLNYPNFPQILFQDEMWSHTEHSEDFHIGYVNLFGVKYLTQMEGLYKKLDSWVKGANGERCLICVHNSYLPMMYAAMRIKNKYKRQITLCLSTGDIPGKEYGLPTNSPNPMKNFLITHIVEPMIMRLVKQFDCFVFVTSHMAEAYDVSDKPFVVVEYAYTEQSSNSGDILYESEIKRIFYAGSIREEYGIGHLLKAFSLIPDSDYRLVLAGGGSQVDEVRRYAERDNRIQYLGFISPQEVRQQQRQSTALISPRLGSLNFTKYSFPGKSVDSLASGVPYIAHRLPCDPPEYARYIQYADDESDEALCRKMMEVCSLPPDKRREIGVAARRFILTEKNPKIMCKRITDMWEKL